MTAKIEPWMLICTEEVHKQYPYIIGDTRDTLQTLAAIIAAHAPKQEPSVPVSKLKTWRNAASIPLTYSDAVAFDDLIRQAEERK